MTAVATVEDLRGTLVELLRHRGYVERARLVDTELPDEYVLDASKAWLEGLRESSAAAYLAAVNVIDDYGHRCMDGRVCGGQVRVPGEPDYAVCAECEWTEEEVER